MPDYVYRLENAEGRGPYTATVDNEICEKYGWKWATRPHSEHQHPTPVEDLGLRSFWLKSLPHKRIKYFRFGFESVDQYLEWFDCPIERDNLFKKGFELKKIEAKEVYYGHKQVLFIPAHDHPDLRQSMNVHTGITSMKVSDQLIQFAEEIYIGRSNGTQT
jgi:hypothetical protein